MTGRMDFESAALNPHATKRRKIEGNVRFGAQEAAWQGRVRTSLRDSILGKGGANYRRTRACANGQSLLKLRSQKQERRERDIAREKNKQGEQKRIAKAGTGCEGGKNREEEGKRLQNPNEEPRIHIVIGVSCPPELIMPHRGNETAGYLLAGKLAKGTRRRQYDKLEIERLSPQGVRNSASCMPKKGKKL